MNNLQNFLMNININDDGMEDLETFNKKYNEEIKKFYINNNNNNNDNNNNNINSIITLNLFKDKYKINSCKFSVKLYLKNILNLLNKKQLFYLINNLTKNLDVNINIITLIKSINTRSKKNFIISRLTEIFIITLNNNNNNKINN